MSRISSSFSQDLGSQRMGSGNTSALSHDEAKSLYERTHQRWSQTNDQLIHAIQERTTSPLSPYDLRQKDFDIANLRRELAEIQTQLAQYQQQLQMAETTILQQQITIRNQSKAIENPRPGREFPLTPSRQRQQYGNQDHLQPQMGNHISYGHQNQPEHFPHNYQNLPPHQQAVRVNSQNSNNLLFRPPVAHRHLPSNSSDSTGGMISQRMGIPPEWQNNLPDPFAPSHVPSSSTGSSNEQQQFSNMLMFSSPDSTLSNPYPESAIPPLTSEGRVRKGFQKLFDVVQAYARTHCNYPSTIGDYSLPQDLKTRLLSASTTTTAFGLMSDQETRYLLISKVMIQWLVKHILKFNAFSGLDTQIDQIIAGAKGVIYQSTPAGLRYSLLTNIANEVQKLRAKQDFRAYVNHLSQHRATQLLQIIRPTMHRQPANEWQDLVTLLQEAYGLAELMLTVTDEFSFEYPECDNRFDETIMINIDPQLGPYTTAQLHSVQAKVRLGSTPVVKIRKNSPQGVATEEVLVKSKVLLRRPR